MRGVYTHHPSKYLRIETYSYTIKQYWACCGRKKRAGPGCKNGPHPNLFGLEGSNENGLCVVINKNNNGNSNLSPDMRRGGRGVRGERGVKEEMRVRSERGVRSERRVREERGRNERREGSEVSDRRKSVERRDRRERLIGRDGNQSEKERERGRERGRENDNEEDKEMEQDSDYENYGNYGKYGNEEDGEEGEEGGGEEGGEERGGEEGGGEEGGDVYDITLSPNSNINSEFEEFHTNKYNSIQVYEGNTENKKYYDLKYNRFDGKDQHFDNKYSTPNYEKKNSTSNFCIPKKTTHSNHGFPTDSKITILTDFENEFNTNLNHLSNAQNNNNNINYININNNNNNDINNNNNNYDINNNNNNSNDNQNMSEIRSKKKVGFDFDRERKKEYLM